MRKIYSYIAAAFSAAVLISSCTQEQPREYEYAEPVDLVMTIDGTNVVMGDDVTVKFATANKEQVSNEEFNIRLTATKNNEDVSHSLFEGFTSKVVFEKGKSEAIATIPVKKAGIKGSHLVTFRAFSRGYKIGGESQNIKVGDYHYVTLGIENNTENKVTEDSKFVLVASMEIPAPEDITVSISPKKGEAAYYADLPSELKIAKGNKESKSVAITMKKDDGRYDNATLTLDIKSSVAKYPVASNTLSIERADVDKPLGTLLGDERHVYPNPSIALLSNKHKDAVQAWGGCSTLSAERSQFEHPTRPGYTLLNAMEFHYIDFMMRGATVAKGNKFGVRPPKGLAAQNTAKVQENIAVNIDKFSTLTPEGYLKIWAAKDRNQATGGTTAWKDYGTACFFACKFNPVPEMTNNHKNIPMHTRIFPGVRAEARIRMGGERNGFNAAFWFQGNNNIGPKGTPWPTCGEIDVMENPVGPATGNAAWQTFHLGNAAGQETKSGGSGAKKVEMTEWNIYWFEWSGDGNTVTMGINGQTNVTLTRAEVEKNGGIWPFCKEQNPEGLHMILTLVGPSAWPLGFGGKPTWTPQAGWDKGFADISYEESKTHKNTPKMEIDWIRFYKNAEYSDDGKEYNKNFYF